MASKSSYQFPEELIFEILSYLPVISLLRFRSVCKSWLSIISDQQFINTHLTNSHKKPATLVLEKDSDHVYLDTREEYIKLNVPPECNSMFSCIYFFDAQCNSTLFHYMCSCNGLVCLAEEYGNVMYLWNPSRRQLKKLHAPKEEGTWDASEFVFVYDSSCDDYKLLRLTVCLSYMHDDPVDGAEIAHDLIADLYSSKTGCFKEISVPENLKSIEVRKNSKCVHDQKTGVVYFEGTSELLSFDLDKEVFGVYPYPFPDLVQCPKSNVLDFEGSAAMIFEDVDGSVLSLWTLHDVCDGKVSWTKKFNIEADVKIDWVFLYLSVGQFVAKDDDGQIFYDFKKNDAKKALSPGPVGEFSSVVKYTESLVSLEGFQGLQGLSF